MPKFLTVFVLICFLLTGLSLLTGSAKATTPSSVDLTYDLAKQELTVTISHPVADTSNHYIKTVEVKKNSAAVSTNQYTSQPTNDLFSYTYNVSAADGDVLEATAICSIAGQKTGSVTVKSPAPDSPPTITITSPADGTGFEAALVTVSGSATGDLATGKVEVQVNNGSWVTATGTDSWSIQVTLAQGTNTISARVTDSKDRTATEVRSLTYTPVAPPVTKKKTTPGFELALALAGLLAMVAVAKMVRKGC